MKKGLDIFQNDRLDSVLKGKSMPRYKEFDREEVLQKAMIAFRDKGYEATSMQELVDSMEINRFSLYETLDRKSTRLNSSH